MKYPPNNDDKLTETTSIRLFGSFCPLRGAIFTKTLNYGAPLTLREEKLKCQSHYSLNK